MRNAESGDQSTGPETEDLPNSRSVHRQVPKLNLFLDIVFVCFSFLLFIFVTVSGAKREFGGGQNRPKSDQVGPKTALETILLIKQNIDFSRKVVKANDKSIELTSRVITKRLKIVPKRPRDDLEEVFLLHVYFYLRFGSGLGLILASIFVINFCTSLRDRSKRGQERPRAAKSGPRAAKNSQTDNKNNQQKTYKKQRYTKTSSSDSFCSLAAQVLGGFGRCLGKFWEGFRGYFWVVITVGFL